MGVLGRIVNDRKLLLGAVVLILLVSAFVRFYHISWSFSNNGIDEGIMIQRARLVGEGYDLYSELPCDQAPLAFYMGAPFGGDVVSLRSLSAIISVAAIAAVMESARRVKGNVAMLAAGLLISFDFAFLRESRLFSLDGISSSFLAFGLLGFILYLQKKSRLMLIASGLFVGLSAATKLLGALGLLGIIVFLILDARKEKRPMKGPVADIVLVTIASAIPLAAFMLYLGPSDFIEGAVMNQGQRTFEPWLKLSLMAYFGLNLAYALPLLYAKRTWSMSREMRFLLSVSVVILVFMILQPLIFLHHLPLMSPALAVLSGVFMVGRSETKKANISTEVSNGIIKKREPSSMAAIALFCVTLASSLSLAGYGLATQGEPAQIGISHDLEAISEKGDWIICGDPLVCAYANRDIPPEIVNVAYRQYPDLTLEDIEGAINKYDVEVVILSWRLLELDGVEDMLLDNNFTRIYPHNDPHWGQTWEDYHASLDFFQEDMGPVHVYWRGP